MAISLSRVAPTMQEIVDLFHSASFRTSPVVEEAVRRRRLASQSGLILAPRCQQREVSTSPDWHDVHHTGPTMPGPKCSLPNLLESFGASVNILQNARSVYSTQLSGIRGAVY